MDDISNDFDEIIELSDENYEDKANDILNSLKDKQSISSISLKSCNLTSENLSNLISNIKDPSYLFEIDVSNNIKLGSSVIHSIFGQPNISPSTLILDNIKLLDDGLISLSKYIENVRILSVASNEITSRGVIVFFSSVDIQFTSLNLASNRIDDSAIFSIKTNIKKLNISSNNFTQSGLMALCDRFSKSEIKTLFMNDLKFAKISKNSFSKLLQSKNLKNLYLRNCSITNFPDIPNNSRLKILDLTGNNNIVEFETTPTVTVIGNILMKKKIQFKFDEFDKMKEILDFLRKENEIIVDSTSDANKLIEKIQLKANELNSLLFRLKRKLKPTVSSLSKYASKINSKEEILQLPKCEKVVEGIPLTPTMSLSTKFNLFNQFLIMLSEMNENSKYFRKNFKINSFVINKDNKLCIKDKEIVSKSKSEDSPIEVFSNQLFGFLPDVSQFNYNLSHSLLTSSINKIRPPPSYDVVRTEESILNLFSNINNSEIMTQFQLKVEGESAIDHGGVLRDILSQFWEKVSISKFEMSDKSVSLLPISGGTNFCEIGKIMAKSLLESIPISIPIHSIVFRFFTNQLPQNKIEWIQSLSEFDPQISSNIDYEAENDDEIIERCKEILIKRREKELIELKKGFFFNQHIEIIIVNMFDWWNLMNDVVGDEELNSLKLIQEIKFINLSQNSISIWCNVIKKFNKDQIKQFLRLITGLNGMPSGGYKKRGKQLIITKSDRFFAHTCSFELESPEFNSEKELIESLSTVFIAMESDYSMNEWYNI